ncbi:thymidylate kinase [soil metagenome]
MIQQSEGKLIVIEGGDGAGKGTQSELLKNYFNKNNIAYAYVDFPNYDSLYGKIIAKFLRGEFGTIEEVSPYLAAMFFALDRTLQKEQISNYIKEGKIVLANRYIPSNIAHQGSKFINDKARETFIEWIEQLEYTINDMPKEDLVIYLHVPWKVATDLTKSKQTRAYLEGQSTDIQENDQNHRIQTDQMYEYLAQKNDEWTTIDCTKNGTILTKENIHECILAALQKHSII